MIRPGSIPTPRAYRAGGGIVVIAAIMAAILLAPSAQAASSPSETPSSVQVEHPQAGNAVHVGHHESSSPISRVFDALHAVDNWLLLGVMVLLGHYGGKLARRCHAPSVVGYLVLGVVLGRSVLGGIDRECTESFQMIADFGLGIVAFMIGTELSRTLIRKLGAKLVVIVVAESLGAFVVVALVIWTFSNWLMPVAGLAMAGALIFGAMAPASAPAGTVAVIQEYKAKGPMTSLLLAVVGLDDGFAIVIYAFAAAMAKMLLGKGGVTLGALVGGPFVEIVGGLLLGTVIGLLLTVAAKRTRDSGGLLTITIGAILFTTGIANACHLSLILSNLSVGAVLVNVSPRHTERAYNVLQQITHPVYVLFFVVAGAHLDLRLLAGLSVLGPIYIAARATGLIGGAFVGASISRAEPVIRRYLGFGILSQAGVAIGLALTVSHEFSAPQYGELGRQLAALTINTIAATTIVFEIIGPITTKIALTAAGEIRHTSTAPGGHR